MTKSFEALDGEPVETVSGTLVVLPKGEAEVAKVAEGYVIEVNGAEAVTVPVAEFDRLIGEGQLHGVQKPVKPDEPAPPSPSND